jgi:hypothetical protein
MDSASAVWQVYRKQHSPDNPPLPPQRNAALYLRAAGPRLINKCVLHHLPARTVAHHTLPTFAMAKRGSDESAQLSMPLLRDEVTRCCAAFLFHLMRCAGFQRHKRQAQRRR